MITVTPVETENTNIQTTTQSSGIIMSSNDIDFETEYMLTEDSGIQKMANAVDQILTIKHFILRDSERLDSKTGEIQTSRVLSIMTDEDEVFATNSMTFIESFVRLAEMYARHDMVLRAVQVVSATSKAGRRYIQCKMVRA